MLGHRMDTSGVAVHLVMVETSRMFAAVRESLCENQRNKYHEKKVKTLQQQFFILRSILVLLKYWCILYFTT